MSDFAIRPIDETDQPQVRNFLIGHWGADTVVVLSGICRPYLLPGFIAIQGDTWVGLVTYQIKDDSCEIVTIDSELEGIGIGSALIEAVEQVARTAGCRRLWLTTTNDNLHALGFYQRRGFTLAALHRDMVKESRKLKPQIPEIGNDGIPIRDAIELEMNLKGR
jgi:ribosomal protein S18 acetylase RimI-like enzyme